MILDRESYRFQEFLSDIAGQDVEGHNNDSSIIVNKVRDFLDNAMSGSNQPLPSGEIIQRDFKCFNADLTALSVSIDLTESTLSFKNYVWIVAEFLAEKA